MTQGDTVKVNDEGLVVNDAGDVLVFSAYELAQEYARDHDITNSPVPVWLGPVSELSTPGAWVLGDMSMPAIVTPPGERPEWLTAYLGTTQPEPIPAPEPDAELQYCCEWHAQMGITAEQVNSWRERAEQVKADLTAAQSPRDALSHAADMLGLARDAMENGLINEEDVAVRLGKDIRDILAARGLNFGGQVSEPVELEVSIDAGPDMFALHGLPGEYDSRGVPLKFFLMVYAPSLSHLSEEEQTEQIEKLGVFGAGIGAVATFVHQTPLGMRQTWQVPATFQGEGPIAPVFPGMAAMSPEVAQSEEANRAIYRASQRAHILAQYVDAGFTHESAVRALVAGDESLLVSRGDNTGE